jgi:hypothetical protein
VRFNNDLAAWVSGIALDIGYNLKASTESRAVAASKRSKLNAGAAAAQLSRKLEQNLLSRWKKVAPQTLQLGQANA